MQLQKTKEEENSQEHLFEISKMTLDQLEDQPIAFGKAKYGVPFKKAYEDLSWVHFIISKYEKSEKKEHQLFVQYVRLRTEIEQMTSKEDLSQLDPFERLEFQTTDTPKKSPTTAIKSKAKPAPGYSSQTNYAPSDLEINRTIHTEEISDLQQRMAGLESVMGEVVTHLRQMAASSPWTVIKEEQ